MDRTGSGDETIKVCVSPSQDESVSEAMESLARQTPGESGVWGNIVGVADFEAADYHISFNQPHPKCDPNRLLLFSAEPPVSDLLSNWESANAVKKYHINDHYKPQRWWIDKTYDEIEGLLSVEKSKPLSWITTDKGAHLNRWLSKLRLALNDVGIDESKTSLVPLLSRGPHDGHLLRMRFLERLVAEYPNRIDLYGRGDFSGPHYNGAIEDKWDGLAKYRYSLAIENYKGPNYFSEKITDALLAWCMPIYWGCTNLDKYLPEDSFVELDIEDPDAPAQIKEIVESDLREENLDAIAEARERLLNEYQIWPTIEKCVNDLEV